MSSHPTARSRGRHLLPVAVAVAAAVVMAALLPRRRPLPGGRRAWALTGGSNKQVRLGRRVEDHDFTPRAVFAGGEEPELGEIFDGLDHKSLPHEWFQRCDAPEKEYFDRAANSENYRNYRRRATQPRRPWQALAKVLVEVVLLSFLRYLCNVLFVC